MTEVTQAVAVSKTALWTGRVLSALPAGMLLFSGGAKVLMPQAIAPGMAHYGYPEKLIVVIGVVEILCALLYALPRTCVLGAILVTGYLGGAIATNVRVGDPLFFIPLLLGMAAWGGIYLRDSRVRVLLPLRS
jgi:DoxX-like protein